MNTQTLTRVEPTQAEVSSTEYVNTAAIGDPLAPENLKDPMSYEDLLPYLMLPIAGCW